MNNNCNEELSIKLIGKLSTEIPGLTEDFELQIKVKEVIDTVIYNYNVSTKCTDLITSDILDKENIFLAVKKLEGLSSKTLYNYKLFLDKLGEYLKKPCSTITTMDLRMFLATYGEGNKASTINGYITCLKTFFGWLQNEEYIIKNPAANLKQTKVPKVILTGYKADNLEKLRDACITSKEKALFEIMESTACRISEITNIKLEDINFSDRSILVTGKGNKQRIVYFSSRAKLCINKYLLERKGDSNYLFISDRAPYKNVTSRSLQKIIHNIQIRSGVEERVYPHKFRRTQATHLLNSGMSLQGVQKFLGHESPETTQRYAQISQENLKNEYKRLIS